MTILDEGSIARDGHEDWAEASGADKRFAGAPLTSLLDKPFKQVQNFCDAIQKIFCDVYYTTTEVSAFGAPFPENRGLL